jgi:precorrin-6B methylase 2
MQEQKEGVMGLFGKRRQQRAAFDDITVLFYETEPEYFSEDISLYGDAENYQATRIKHLQSLMEYLSPGPEDIFVDFGCGKGRVACYAALKKIKKVIGVELRPALANHAQELIRRLSLPTPVEIVNKDAAEYYDEEGTIYYLFNPFGRATVERVIDNIHKSITAVPRLIRIAYNNGIHNECLALCGWLQQELVVPGTDIQVWRSTNVL